MLGKLLKHEFKGTAKVMVLFYAALILLSVIFSITAQVGFVGVETDYDFIVEYELANNFFGLSSILLFLLIYFMIIAVMVATVIYSISRFKNTVLGPEGYLTHTLPVKTRDIILSRTINSIIWQTFSIIAVIISLFIIVMAFGVFSHSLSGPNAGELLSPEEVKQLSIIAVEALIFMLVSSISFYLHVFASMSVGFSANKHRVIKSVGVFVLCYWVEMFMISFLTSLDMVYVESTNETTISLLFILILIYTLISIAFYFITSHFLSKKLNLQ